MHQNEGSYNYVYVNTKSLQPLKRKYVKALSLSLTNEFVVINY